MGAAQSDSARVVSGESGSFYLNPRVNVTYSTRVTEPRGDRRAWLKLAILWRGQPTWRTDAYDDSIATVRAELEFDRKAHDAIAVGGWWAGAQVGKVIYGAIHDREGRWVQILGKRWSLPLRDSALVILVDRIDGVGGSPIIVEHRLIESSLPANVFGYNTTSRDTLHSLRPPASVRSALLELLSRSPTIREFWQ